MKFRVLFTFIGVTAILFLAAYLRSPETPFEYSCDVSSEQVVINMYKNDDLLQSISISSQENQFKVWVKGQDAPRNVGIRHFYKDWIPSETEGYKSLRLQNDNQLWLYDADVSEACYDAL